MALIIGLAIILFAICLVFGLAKAVGQKFCIALLFCFFLIFSLMATYDEGRKSGLGYPATIGQLNDDFYTFEGQYEDAYGDKLVMLSQHGEGRSRSYNVGEFLPEGTEIVQVVDVCKEDTCTRKLMPLYRVP